MGKGIGGHDSVALELTGGEDPVTTTPAPDCFQHDVQYNSHNMGNANLEDAPRNLLDPQSCQDACKATKGCECFTWNGRSQCWLMTACVTPTKNSGFVAGNATCGGELVI